MKTLIEASKLRSKKINKIEKLKETKTANEALMALDEYAKKGYDSIAKDDKAFFLKSFGIFDKQKVHGDNSFMIRVRIPGGRLSYVQAKKLGELAYSYGKDYIDITTRAQIEFRYMKIEDLPTVIEELRSVGITTYQTGVDNFRNIVTSAYDGISEDSVIECMPIIEELQSIYLKKDEWLNALPRKFNTAILGNRINDCNIYGHDCCFVLAKKNDVYGFNVYLGGRVGVQASDTDIFVTKEEVCEFYIALIYLYKKYGFRDNRNKNRLHFLIQEVGLEALVESIKEQANNNFNSKGIIQVDKEHKIPHDNEIKLTNNNYALHFSIPSGIFSGSNMILASKMAKKYNGFIRLSVEQSFYIAGVSQSDIKSIKQEELYTQYREFNNIYFNNLIACAGIDTCPFGVIPNKPDAIKLSRFLNDEVLMEDGKIRIYWSACPKGCGIHGVADIGLEGCKAKDDDGKSVDGVHIFLGGKATLEAKEARIIYKALPLTKAKDIIKNIVEIYRDEREDGESFEMFDSRVLSSLSVEEIVAKVS